MLRVEIGENSARVVALQILLNRSRSIQPKLTTDGDFGAKTRAAVDTFRDKEIRQSGPAGVADPAMWRFMLERADLQVVDAIDVTDPSLLEQVVPEVSKWTEPIVLGGLSNGVEQLVQEVRARVRGERTLLMLRLHGHGAPGLAAVSHGSRHVSPGIDPIAAQSIIALALMPTLLPLLQRLEPLFHDFGFVELHSCRVGLGATGATFVRRFADAVQAPVRAALSRQQAPQVFTLTAPPSPGFRGAARCATGGSHGRKGCAARSDRHDHRSLSGGNPGRER
jgi:hypothetical protein